MRIGHLEIVASRWPWQEDRHSPIKAKYGWIHPERFGGGRSVEFGFSYGRNTLMINLVFGLIRLYWLNYSEVLYYQAVETRTKQEKIDARTSNNGDR